MTPTMPTSKWPSASAMRPGSRTSTASSISSETRRRRCRYLLKCPLAHRLWTCSRVISRSAKTHATARSTDSSPSDPVRSNSLYELILDYPRRGGKALRPALSIATCLGLGGHLEAILPTAATLELYHNAFLIHDDIEDESWRRRGRPTLHMDHGIPIAVNVGDAMLSMSLQPLLDNVERVGLGPALRTLRAVAHMTRQTVDGQALELEWVRSNTWQLDDADYLAMVELKTSWYSFISTAGRCDCGWYRTATPAADGVARPTSRSGVPDHRRPAEPAGGPGGVRQRNRRRPLGGQTHLDAAAHNAFCRARTTGIGPVQVLAMRRPGDGRRNGAHCVTRPGSSPAGELSCDREVRDRGEAATGFQSLGVEGPRRYALALRTHAVPSGSLAARASGRPQWHAGKAAGPAGRACWFPPSRHRDVLCRLGRLRTPSVPGEPRECWWACSPSWRGSGS